MATSKELPTGGNSDNQWKRDSNIAHDLSRQFDIMLNKQRFSEQDLWDLLTLLPAELPGFNGPNEPNIRVHGLLHSMISDIKQHQWANKVDENVYFGTREENKILPAIYRLRATECMVNDISMLTRLKEIISVARAVRATGTGNTQVYNPLGAIIMTKHSETSSDYRRFSDYMFLEWTGQYEVPKGLKKRPKRLDYGGNVMLLMGTQGSGKTDFACLLAEKAMKADIEVISNIELTAAVRNDYDKYHFVTRVSQLYFEAIKNVKLGLPSLAIIDEVALNAQGKQDTSTLEVKDTDKMLRISRKLMMSMAFIIHEARQVATLMEGSTKVMVEKYGSTENPSRRTEAKIIEYDKGTPVRAELIRNIPKTNLEFKTGALASYKGDLSITTVFYEIADFLESHPNDDEQYDEINRVISAHRNFYDQEGMVVHYKDKNAMKKYKAYVEAQARRRLEEAGAVNG